MWEIARCAFPAGAPCMAWVKTCATPGVRDFKGRPPVDMRKYNVAPQNNKHSYAARLCHSFLHYMWENVAQDFAEGRPDESNPYLAYDSPVIIGLESESADVRMLDDIVSRFEIPAECKDQRWLPHQTMTELHHTMEVWVDGYMNEDEAPSFTTFLRIWKFWYKKKTLRIRFMGQHSECKTCAESAERLRS